MKRFIFIILFAVVSTFFVLANSFADPSTGLRHRVEALEAMVTALQQLNTSQQADIVELTEDLASANSQIEALSTANEVLSELVEEIESDTGELMPLVGIVPFLTVNDSGDDKNVVFSGVNLQIVDGSGDTHGPVNGLGNLIIGYNEFRPLGDEIRTGSHNLVVGEGHTYTSYGGVVSGKVNKIMAEGASCIGGIGNEASGRTAVVISGRKNKALRAESVVSGGWENTAAIDRSVVIGGKLNRTEGIESTVTGGLENIASGLNSSVSGGNSNEANGFSSSISGGKERSIDFNGSYDWRAGGSFEDD